LVFFFWTHLRRRLRDSFSFLRRKKSFDSSSETLLHRCANLLHGPASLLQLPVYVCVCVCVCVRERERERERESVCVCVYIQELLTGYAPAIRSNDLDHVPLFKHVNFCYLCLKKKLEFNVCATTTTVITSPFFSTCPALSDIRDMHFSYKHVSTFASFLGKKTTS
jgi:hypothetical protein